MNVKLYRIEGGYQTKPVCGTGIGRFQITRMAGREKWKVSDLYGDVTRQGIGWERFATLAEIREWIARRIERFATLAEIREWIARRSDS